MEMHENTFTPGCPCLSFIYNYPHAAVLIRGSKRTSWAIAASNNPISCHKVPLKRGDVLFTFQFVMYCKS